MSKKLKVVLVDDEAQSLEKLAVFLQGQNCEVSRFTDAERAMRHMETTKPQIVVTDYRMPSMTGMQLLARMRRQHPNVPVIVLGDSNSHAIEKDGGIYVAKSYAHLQLPGALKEAAAKIPTPAVPKTVRRR